MGRKVLAGIALYLLAVVLLVVGMRLVGKINQERLARQVLVQSRALAALSQSDTDLSPLTGAEGTRSDLPQAPPLSMGVDSVLRAGKGLAAGSLPEKKRTATSPEELSPGERAVVEKEQAPSLGELIDEAKRQAEKTAQEAGSSPPPQEEADRPVWEEVTPEGELPPPEESKAEEPAPPTPKAELSPPSSTSQAGSGESTAPAKPPQGPYQAADALVVPGGPAEQVLELPPTEKRRLIIDLTDFVRKNGVRPVLTWYFQLEDRGPDTSPVDLWVYVVALDHDQSGRVSAVRVMRRLDHQRQGTMPLSRLVRLPYVGGGEVGIMFEVRNLDRRSAARVLAGVR